MALDIQHPFPEIAGSEKLSRRLKWLRELITERLLPDGFPNLEGKEAERWIDHQLPLIKWEAPLSAPGLIEVYFLCSPTHEVKADSVIPQLIRKWLIPEKEIHIAGFHNLYFYGRPFSSRLFFAAEMQIVVEQEQDLSTILQHLPLLSHEVNLSLSSAQYAEVQLDTKALSLDQKSTQVQGYLRRLLRRSPTHFDVDLLREMSTFLAISEDGFRRLRLPKHLTRLVVSHYLMCKRLLHHLSVTPGQRHLELRINRSKLQFPFGVKRVLSLSMAIALYDRYETFDDGHIVDAVQSIVPEAKALKDSYYFRKANYDPIKYLYLELEKGDRTLFSQEEIARLRRELKENLKKRVERLIPAVFMIRNEEEIMRNILILSQEFRYLSDLPQVMIHFEKQEGDKLFFTVIVVRIKRVQDPSVEDAFKGHQGDFRFIADRVQNVGYIRKKTPKEASVFHICIPKEKSIQRADSAVDFYLARKKVLSIVSGALGEVRDYNGGMILKQGELLSQLKQAFPAIKERERELLENFFFSLTPIEAQATASLSSLKVLLALVFEAANQELPKRDSYFQKIAKRKGLVCAVLRTRDPSLDPILGEDIVALEHFSKSLIRSQVRYQGILIQGYIYETASKKQICDFEDRMESGIKAWLVKIRNQQELRLSFADLPQPLDPRLGGDDYSSNLMKMLFEGLTRIDRNSRPAPALAESIDISSDQMRYTFKLRPSLWSDGSALTAQDFEYAWKKVLSPSFYTPFAYFFYPIKNAQAAKNGEVSIDSVGIYVPDDMTIEIELEAPTPEFLEQTAHALYSPINRKHDCLHPNWAQDFGDGYICNGPMKLKHSLLNRRYELIKNPNYWEASPVKLDRITITKNSSKTAFEMFKNDEIDWLGHPIRPWEPYYAACGECINHTELMGAHWCVFNTQRYPFDHLKLRQALSLAIDRAAVVAKLADIPGPATSPLPLVHSSVTNSELIYGDQKLAVQLFEEALCELGLHRDRLPVITLIYPKGSCNRKLVAEELARLWKEVLGLRCRLETLQFRNLFLKMLKGDFQIGTINWKSWINSAFYTLNAFEYRSNRVNFSKWEHPQYSELLKRAQLERCADKRAELLKRTEELLVQECPILPIHYESYNFTYKQRLVNAFCSDAGNIDFKWASIAPK